MNACEPLPLPAPTTEAWLAWIDAAAMSLKTCRAAADGLRDAPPRDARATLEAWNSLQLTLADLSARTSLISEVHPDTVVRGRAEDLARQVEALSTSFGLDPDLYRVFQVLDPTGLDPVATRLLDRVLRTFRRSGVALGPEDRERVRTIRDELTGLGQTFARTIREDTRTVELRPDQLVGLPQDWLEAHPVKDDGLVTVTTDYPDAIPLRMFARDPEARRAILQASLTIGYPANVTVLHDLLARRIELAQLLGYDSWPDFDTETKMIGTGAAVAAFIDQIARAAREPAQRDLSVLLARLQRDDPTATTLTAADALYYTELHRREALQVDAQEVRTFFDFGRVRQGLLDVTGRLFGLDFLLRPDIEAWHPDVTAYDVHGQSGTMIGRIYLDLHPREGKFKHAAQFTLTHGIRDRQCPEAVLV